MDAEKEVVGAEELIGLASTFLTIGMHRSNGDFVSTLGSPRDTDNVAYGMLMMLAEKAGVPRSSPFQRVIFAKRAQKRAEY